MCDVKILISTMTKRSVTFLFLIEREFPLFTLLLAENKRIRCGVSVPECAANDLLMVNILYDVEQPRNTTAVPVSSGPASPHFEIVNLRSLNKT